MADQPRDQKRWHAAPPPHAALIAFVQELYEEGITSRRAVNTRLVEGEFPWTFGSESTFRRWRDKYGVSRPGRDSLPLLPNLSDDTISDKIVTLGEEFSTSGSRTIQFLLSLEGMVVGEKRLRRIIKEVYPERAAARRWGQRTVPRRPIALFNGSNQQWSGDGHDKLRDWGFCFYGWRDVFSGQIITMRVLPSNRLAHNTHWVFLDAVLSVGGKSILAFSLYDEADSVLVPPYPGFPHQIATDRGSETDQFSGTQAWLREKYGNEVSPLVVPHRYLTSTHNITIERCWRGLIKHVVEPAGEAIARGRTEGGFVSTNDAHIRVFWFLFVPLITESLNKFLILHNNQQVRYQREKRNPSGCRRIDVWQRPEDFGGEQCLIPLNDEPRRVLEIWREDAYRQGDMQWLTAAEYDIIAAGLETLRHTDRWYYSDVWALFSRLTAVVIDDLYVPLQRRHG